MSNYEIMLILDPKSDEKIVTEIANSTFSSKEIKIEKLERTELAYEINKSKTAIYFLINVKATGVEINEFTRKSNITKSIWRSLSINLDTEKGLNRKAKAKKVKRSLSSMKKSAEAASTEKESKKVASKKVKVTEEGQSESKTKKSTKKAKEEE